MTSWGRSGKREQFYEMDPFRFWFLRALWKRNVSPRRLDQDGKNPYVALQPSKSLFRNDSPTRKPHPVVGIG